jgi:hypothetical protein
MRDTNLRCGLDLASALDIWADARERAAGDLWRKAAGLDRAGQVIEAARLRSAARQLNQKLLQERARAGAVRSTARRPRTDGRPRRTPAGA